MRCSKAHKLMSLSLDGELPAKEGEALESHLNGCGDCAGELHALQGMNRLLPQMKRFPAPPGFSRRVMASLETPPPRLTFTPFLLRFAEAAVVLLVIGIGVVFGSFLDPTPELPNTGNGAALLSLDIFDPTPPGSLSGAYLAMMEGGDEQ